MYKLFLLSFCVLFSQNLFSQNTLQLKSGKIELSSDISLSQNSTYYFMVFSKIPTNEEQESIKSIGFDFLDYIPHNTYVVSVSKDANITNLSDFGVESLSEIKPQYKIDPKLQNNSFPTWALNNNMLSVKVLLYKNADLSNLTRFCRSRNYQIDDVNDMSNSITLTIAPAQLSTLSELNEVWYIEPIDPPGFPENKTGRTLHRSNAINTNYSTGRHYNGDGVNVVMQDDGYVQPHIDRQGRIDESFCVGCSSNAGNDHGDHCSGTIMGAGNLDPLGKGMADGAFLYTMGYSTNNYTNSNAFPSLYTNYDVVVTSTSYSNGCNAGYTSLARDIDEQSNSFTHLIHVFSAGNNGSSSCTSPYISGTTGANWGNVTGGHKQAKNVIAVANLTSIGNLAASSSRGPAADGRIKPDIGAKGSSVYSTEHNNTYGTKTGTSMSCPGIAGIMAQLYQAYKELNNGQNPKSSIMKNILLNSADDIGNPGPDFKNGWGEVNALRAVNILENNQYFTDNISQGTINTHQINIPQGTKHVNIMVYWHDKEGSANASVALVNDLDIELVDNSGNLVELPWILDPTANVSALNSNATKGNDHLNNMEQITLENPNPGNYNLLVSGYSIPFGPQEYSVSYIYSSDDVKLTYPIGGESMVPGETEAIRWDAHGTSTDFSLEYSINGGSTWNTINSNISGTERHYNWSVTSNVTSSALFRISRGGYSDQSDEYFTIIDVPANLNVYWPCPDSINVSWTSVNSASSYEISMLGQKYMDSIYTTNNTNVWILNPNPNVIDNWFSVCAKYNDGKGRRAIAVNAQSINNICYGYGCTDPLAVNYDPNALVNNGSCCYNSGCMDQTAINYDSTACFDDGSCIAPILGCTNPNATNFDPNANTTLAFGGPVDNSFGTGSYFNGDQHLIFNAVKQCIIKSAMIYAEAANTITFELRNNSGNVIDDTTLSVVAGPQRINLNFEVPIATDLELGVASGALQNDGLYRNNSGPSFPYNIASAINITSSSAGSAPLGYYYFYYDIEVETPCIVSGNPSWDCDAQGTCFDPGTGNGQYTSLTSCQASCITPSWDCDGQGNCSDPGTGNGQYTSLNSCQASCITLSWDCDAQGTCFDPGTGNGQYTSLNSCQTSCITPSWDCDGQGICFDPGTGNGQYSNVADCELECVNVSTNELSQEEFNIFPNPMTSHCTVISTNKIKKIQVFDISSRICILKYPNSNSIVLDVLDLSKGVYTIELITDKETFKRKLIIQ